MPYVAVSTELWKKLTWPGVSLLLRALWGAVMLVWFVASFINGHIRRDMVPRAADIRAIPRDVAGHARLRLSHGRSYGSLQKLSYFVLLFILFPLIILTGLTMSPEVTKTARTFRKLSTLRAST